jgi:SGNH domain (fused to AT3 domains)
MHVAQWNQRRGPARMFLCLVTLVVMLFAITVSAWASGNHSASASPVLPLSPAPGQPDPTSLWAAQPIPLVAAAARAARQHAPLPRPIVPPLSGLVGPGVVPRGCVPAWETGATGKICRLGDPVAKQVIAVIGDSHSQAWTPALVKEARALGVAVVPLGKAGCFLYRVHANTSQWPCATWYQWALAQDRKLHPVATIVSFQLTTSMQTARDATTSELQSVLDQVHHGVVLIDPPFQTQLPKDCLSQADANMGRCSARVPSTYVPLMRSLAVMSRHTGHSAIPTLQWFCSGGICPMVIDHTVTTSDRSHMTDNYSDDLGPLLKLELQPILARFRRS